MDFINARAYETEYRRTIQKLWSRKKRKSIKQDKFMKIGISDLVQSLDYEFAFYP
jgi:hypothetical protein